jgi:hypothetical protein
VIGVGVKEKGSFFLLPWLTHLGLPNSWHRYAANVQAPVLAKRGSVRAENMYFIAFQLAAIVMECHGAMQN